MATKKSSIVAADNDWQVEDDMRTLARAEEIKRDTKRYKAAVAMAKKRMEELQDLVDDQPSESKEESKETN